MKSDYGTAKMRKNAEGIPKLEIDGRERPALLVEGREFIILGGEVHNSTASDRNYMQSFVWDKLGGLPINTLLVPVTWDIVEREKGRYDYSMPQWIMEEARKKGIRIIFLWFGLWKNGESYYIPGWMKKDTEKYFRACRQNGELSATISPFCDAAIEENQRAFSSFMAFLREFDGNEHTVIMVQVENEVGFLGSDRDYCKRAQEKYLEEIPDEVKEICPVSGNWKQAFGTEAPEYFMSWYFAKAVERIAQEGRKEYALPLFVNAWLDLFPFRPGTYPSGGPIAKVIPIWKKAAQSVDLLCPDIYDSDFYGICDRYSSDKNALFIPETGRQPGTASHVMGMFGMYPAIGISVFGVDDILNAKQYDGMSETELDALRIDWRWDHCRPENSMYLWQAYQLMDSLKELYFKQKNIKGFARRNEHDKGAVISLGMFDVVLSWTDGGGRAGSGGMLIPVNEFCFYLAGCNASVKIYAKRGEEYLVEPAGVWEGHFECGSFVEGRKLNGDELFAQCRLTDIPSVLKIEVTVHGNTCDIQIAGHS